MSERIEFSKLIKEIKKSIKTNGPGWYKIVNGKLVSRRRPNRYRHHQSN